MTKNMASGWVILKFSLLALAIIIQVSSTINLQGLDHPEQGSIGSTVVELLHHHPKLAGLNLAPDATSTKREKWHIKKVVMNWF